MTKYLKRNRFSTTLIAGILFFSLASCEKDTGDLGLNTLPATDGISIHYDSATIVGYETQSYLPKGQAWVSPKVKQLGTVIENIGNGQFDTIVSEVVIPMYYPIWHGSSRIVKNVEGVYFKFSDDFNNASSGYVYGNTTSPLKIVLEKIVSIDDSLHFTTETIDTIDYDPTQRINVQGDSSVAFSHKLPEELSAQIVQAVKQTMTEFPYDPDNENEYIDNIVPADVRQFFYERSTNFKGIVCRVLNPGNYFISRIIAPHIDIKYRYNETDTRSMSFRLASYETDEADDDVIPPYSMITHSTTINSDGALIQGLYGHRTILDFSFMEPWITDSTNVSFNRASVSFPYEENPDGRAQLDTLQFIIKRVADDSIMWSTRIPKNTDGTNAYSTELQVGLNKVLSQKTSSHDYSFELRSSTNILHAEKTILDYSAGNVIRFTYTKY